jgi:hypothetical protein
MLQQWCDLAVNLLRIFYGLEHPNHPQAVPNHRDLFSIEDAACRVEVIIVSVLNKCEILQEQAHVWKRGNARFELWCSLGKQGAIVRVVALGRHNRFQMPEQNMVFSLQLERQCEPHSRSW